MCVIPLLAGATKSFVLNLKWRSTNRMERSGHQGRLLFREVMSSQICIAPGTTYSMVVAAPLARSFIFVTMRSMGHDVQLLWLRRWSRSSINCKVDGSFSSPSYPYVEVSLSKTLKPTQKLNWFQWSCQGLVQNALS